MASQSWKWRQRSEEALAIPTEPDEVLVADVRGAMTPSQMVEQKLLALLGTGHPGLFAQAVGRPHRTRSMGGA